MKIEGLKAGLVSGILGSMIFFIVFQPLLTKAGWVMNGLISIFFRNYTDSMYLTAAMKNTNAVTDDVISMLTGMIVGLIFSVSIVSYYVVFIEDKNKLNDYNVDTNRTKRKKRTIKYLWIIQTILVLIIAVMITTNLYKNLTSVKLIYKFEQDIVVLSEVLSQSELSKLKSQWAYMETKNDYNFIKIRINQLAEINNIELP
ncbi:hypothetical protein MKY95_08370 [Paenibacillus sp. FSL P4-0176]|uniref:hypothetical protein n=1 Tax=Paenibacillus sp. FSL P4-0176 TaxID=2921631 RepID=UPI0030D3C090